MPINPASINVIPNNNVVELVQPGIITVQVTAPGPQGPQGPAGSGGTDTGSLLTTASVSLNTITFTKGNGTTFLITVDTGSGGGGGGGTAGVQSVISSSAGAYVSASGNNVLVSASIFQVSASSIQLTGSLTSADTVVFSNVNNQFTGSLAGTSSWATNAQTSSYVLQAISASFASNGGVTQLLAGPNITLSPTNGLGQVTINSTGGGGGNFNTATGSYGSFYSTQTQTNVAGTARSMSLNVTDITNGVSISGSTNPFNTYIKIQNAGVYDIQFSAQVDKTDSGTDEIWIWLRKNGTDINDSATSIQLVGNGAHYVAAWNFFVNAAANDYFQLMWYSPDANVRLHAEPAFGVVPGIPSLIVTANRVDQFLSNTGSFTGSFTGNLIGTASWANNAVTSSYILNAISSSFAATASLAPNSVTTASVSLNTITFTKGDASTFSLTVNTGSGGGGGGAGFPFTGDAVITGSLLVSGSGVTITGSLNMMGPIIVPYNTQLNSYTLQLSDAGDIVEMNVGSANTVTIPSSSVTNFRIGTQITVVQYGTGQTTFTTGSTNVSLRSAGNATKLAAQFAGATLIKRGTDEWYLLGNVTV